MIEAKHKVAALVHIAHGGRPGVWPVGALPSELWTHLEDRGWVVVTWTEQAWLLTAEGGEHLRELLYG